MLFSAEGVVVLWDHCGFGFFKLLNNRDVVCNIDTCIAADCVYVEKEGKIALCSFENFSVALSPVFLYGLGDVEKDMIPFSRSLVSMKNRWMAMDLKAVVRPTSDRGDCDMKSAGGCNLSVQGFILTGMWAVEKYCSLYDLKFSCMVFAGWLSKSLAWKFSVDLDNLDRAWGTRSRILLWVIHG